MTDLKCSYCGSLNGGHTMACSALAQSADEGDPDIKRYGWSREQVPLTAEERGRMREWMKRFDAESAS